jgi:hypothetical protein
MNKCALETPNGSISETNRNNGEISCRALSDIRAGWNQSSPQTAGNNTTSNFTKTLHQALAARCPQTPQPATRPLFRLMRIRPFPAVQQPL